MDAPLNLIQSTFVEQGATLIPDENGVYKDATLVIIGTPSSNQFAYEQVSTLNALQNPNSIFRRRLQGGGLSSEWGHPFIDGMSKPQAIKRIQYIDPNNTCSDIIGINITKLPNNIIRVAGDFIPMGPKADLAKERLNNPNVNIGFSLRALVKNTSMQNGVVTRQVLSMSTFDTVPVPGFKEAWKRIPQVATEEVHPIMVEDTFSLPITEEDAKRAAAEGNFFGFEEAQVKDLVHDLDFANEHVILSLNNALLGVRTENGITTADGTPISVFHKVFPLMK